MFEQLRRLGYIRTSLINYRPKIQVDTLKQVGCSDLYEVNSRADPCKVFEELPNMLGDGDTLFVYCLDRLGRDECSVVSFQRQLEAMGVKLITSDDQEATGGNYAE